MFRIGLIAATLSLTGLIYADEKSESCPDHKKHYRATIRHIESGGIGYDDGYTTLETFLALDPGQWPVTPFLDARGHVFDNGKWAANVGAGLRALWNNRAYGINAYYDYRDPGQFTSNQIGVGVETLGQWIDFRINGYLPLGTTLSDPYDTSFDSFSGNHMYLAETYQSAMKGADAEIGLHFGKIKFCDFYAAIGPYYFIGEKTPTTWGGKARVSGVFKEILTLEISDSYDSTFHNKFQGQIGLTYSFGPKSKVKAKQKGCQTATILTERMVQPVGRQEIIVVDDPTVTTVATDPSTGLPYFFVFVDNTSHSNGTFESPWHSLAQAAAYSSPSDIIYLFPGDGTTAGMNAGFTLKAHQKFWGSGMSHSLDTQQGTISIPAQSTSSPTITNTDFDTEGNGITLATYNEIEGIKIRSPLNDAIYGTNPISLEVSSCTFETAATYAIETTSTNSAVISIRDNQFLNNVNGVSLTLNGTSTITCSNNTFSGQTSVSNVPIEISSNNNNLTVDIENNRFQNNITGSIRFAVNSLVSGDINVENNTIMNNGTGSQSTLGSSFVIIPSGTTNNCSISLVDNTFSNNTSNALYLHTSGLFTTLDITATGNTMSNNGGSGLVMATPVTYLTFNAIDNTITGGNDNAIAIIASGTTSTGGVTISNNTIQDVGNSSNGIAVNQNFSTLNLSISNNTINSCEGTGILSYSSGGIDSLRLDISENTITNCQNLSSNAASGLDIEQFTNLQGSITNNTFSGNTPNTVVIGTTLTAPTACLTLSGNVSSDYLITNPIDGTFNLAPCNVDSANTGIITTSGTVNNVQSCPAATPCPP